MPTFQNASIEKSKVLVYISHVQYIQRRLATVLLDAARHFPAVVVTGPRRAGKTTLLRKLFPKAQYVLLEDPETVPALRPKHCATVFSVARLCVLALSPCPSSSLA